MQKGEADCDLREENGEEMKNVLQIAVNMGGEEASG